MKETLYQAVPYVGMAKVADFVGITNEVLEARGVTLPLAGQSTTSSADRFEKGLAVQRSIMDFCFAPRLLPPMSCSHRDIINSDFKITGFAPSPYSFVISIALI